jgi:hypothetical protein
MAHSLLGLEDYFDLFLPDNHTLGNPIRLE